MFGEQGVGAGTVYAQSHRGKAIFMNRYNSELNDRFVSLHSTLNPTLPFPFPPSLRDSLPSPLLPLSRFLPFPDLYPYSYSLHPNSSPGLPCLTLLHPNLFNLVCQKLLMATVLSQENFAAIAQSVYDSVDWNSVSTSTSRTMPLKVSYPSPAPHSPYPSPRCELMAIVLQLELRQLCECAQCLCQWGRRRYLCGQRPLGRAAG